MPGELIGATQPSPGAKLHHTNHRWTLFSSPYLISVHVSFGCRDSFFYYYYFFFTLIYITIYYHVIFIFYLCVWSLIKNNMLSRDEKYYYKAFICFNCTVNNYCTT